MLTRSVLERVIVTFRWFYLFSSLPPVQENYHLTLKQAIFVCLVMVLDFLIRIWVGWIGKAKNGWMNRQIKIDCLYFSHADVECSGKRQCNVQVLLLALKFTPCPRELSSYLEASYICLPGIHKVFIFMVSSMCLCMCHSHPNWSEKILLDIPNTEDVNLQRVFFIFIITFPSYVDKECSGQSQCNVQVPLLVFQFTPCPRELSAYLEASYVCLPGNLNPDHYFHCEFAKLSTIKILASIPLHGRSVMRELELGIFAFLF